MLTIVLSLFVALYLIVSDGIPRKISLFPPLYFCPSVLRFYLLTSLLARSILLLFLDFSGFWGFGVLGILTS